MAKDETEIGITGKPIPKKKRSPAKQHKFEKERRQNLGTNVGGHQYSSDVNPYTNPRARTFEEFMNILDENLTQERAKEALKKYKIAKTKKISSQQPPLRKGEVRTFNRTTGKWESNLDG